MVSQGASPGNLVEVGVALARISFITFTATGLKRLGSTWLSWPPKSKICWAVPTPVARDAGSYTGIRQLVAPPRQLLLRSPRLEKSPFSHCAEGMSKRQLVGRSSFNLSRLNMK